MIVPECIRSDLIYNPETGVFTWARRMRARDHDSVAGAICSNGYRTIGYKQRRYYAHRLAFWFMTGAVPKVVDHINGDRDDNRWENLRDARLHGNNIANAKVSKRNSVGLKGVSLDRRTGRYIASGSDGSGKKVHLGVYDTPDEAHDAYKSHAVRLYGEFARFT